MRGKNEKWTWTRKHEIWKSKIYGGLKCQKECYQMKDRPQFPISMRDFFIEIKMAAFLNFNKKQWRNRSSKFDNNGYKNGRFLIKFKKEKFLFKKLIQVLRFVI